MDGAAIEEYQRLIWKNLTTNPPAGFVWASDGLRVWPIHSLGGPITSAGVKYWTEAHIPTPPLSLGPARRFRDIK